ncbi:DUF3536 domain-containing protein [Pontibacter harenae]|uniref:DUF3536 domain-containing protein n=1 Tax=Pontibacter harenae TaxID=2894083 RepID=UPI001E60D897|nr:DUF3536 domain-containing protein [Pontibacter harenae]MCC9166290.1 DUF3536 domain-containing protein [Pontibacter harenae]
MQRYVCVHGHFYQPPRENPWLSEVELQESAYPYHDWNERISDECYAKNSASRILDESGAIVDIMNNYAHMSFNFGPTLLEWMEKKDPGTYRAILEADKESQRRFSGHGSAIAQVYNHMIMPLANERDKHTQVIWGKADFQRRFGRDPEGMWLGETAADTPTLEVLAAHDIKFTILSPYQAKRYRKIGEEKWEDGTGAKIDPRRPYLCKLPSGKSIVLFFYDGPVSQGIAFEGLLHYGDKFAKRLMSTLDSNGEGAQLMHIATDGETYGHHHRFGEMAFSFALQYIEKDPTVQLTVYGEFLEKHPPEYEVEIAERTSWSCAHGVERWRSDCGCNTGGNPNWNQAWRGPLRAAFDWLRDQLEPLYETEMKKFGANPWKARDEYIDVIRDRSEENVLAFIRRHSDRRLTKEQMNIFLKLLEMQYHAMLMYTSCGWFFDEVTGIESMQDILYAARAVQIANNISGQDYETPFTELLSIAQSNIKEERDAAYAYFTYVKPNIIDLLRVGAHYAVSSLFAEHTPTRQLYSYKATSEYHEKLTAGRQKLAIGRARIRSKITWSEIHITYGVLHLGDHQLFGGVREFSSNDAFDTLFDELKKAFDRGNVSEVIMLLDKHFESHSYSFWHLFKDDQKKILDEVLGNAMHSIENDFQQVYDNNYPLVAAMRTLGKKLPKPLQVTVEYVVFSRLLQELELPNPHLDIIKRLFVEAERMSLKLDLDVLNFAASGRAEKLMQHLQQQPDNIDLMNLIIDLLTTLQQSPLKPDYWQAQNIAFRMRLTTYPYYKNSEDKELMSSAWVRQFNKLCNILNLKF